MTWSRQHPRPDDPRPRLSKGGNDPVDVTCADGTIRKATAPGAAADIRARVDQAVTNPASGDLRHEIARLRVLIDLAWDDYVAGTPSAGEDVLGAYHAMDRALAAGDEESARQQWAVLGERLEQGRDQARRHERFLHLIECKRKLIDTYAKNLRVTTRIFTIDEVGVLVTALGTAIKRRVPDRVARRQIFDDFDAAVQPWDLWSVPGSKTMSGASPVKGTNDDDVNSEE